MLQTTAIGIFVLLFAAIAWRRLNRALIILYSLLPAYLIRFQIGPLPSTLLEVMIWIIVITWLLKKARYINFHLLVLQNKSLFLSLFLFLIAATISVFTSIHFREAAGEWKAFYVEPILLFFVLIASIENKKTAPYLLGGLILSGLATSLLAIYQHWTGWLVPDAFWANRATYRVTAWYGFPNAVGMFLAPLLPLAVYLLKQTWQSGTQTGIWNLEFGIWKKRRRFHIPYSIFQIQFLSSLLFIPASLLAILFAKSVGPLLAVGVGIAVLFVLQKRWKWLLTITLACILLTLALAATVPDALSGRLYETAKTKFYSINLRVNIWAETIEFLHAHPITGAGLASYQTLIYPYRIDKWVEVFHHPHNIFLTMWVDLGLLGLLGFIGIIVWFYETGISSIKSSTNRLAPYLLATMTTWLTMGLVDSPYIKNDLAVMFWLLPALLIIANRRQKN